MTWPAPGEGGGMSGASHIDGANPIGRVKNGNGQLSTERQDRMMVDAWSVDRDATSSFCVFVLPAIFHSRTGAEVRSRLQLCEREERSTVQRAPVSTGVSGAPRIPRIPDPSKL